MQYERRFGLNFNPEALLDLSPSDSDGSCSESIDAFEAEIMKNNPTLAKEIFDTDKATYKSHKEAKREREAKFVALAATQGRALYDQMKFKYKCLPDALQNMKMNHDGPLKMLVTALKTKSRVEVRIRSHTRVDRIACGLLTAFDYQFNLVLHDSDELFLPGRKEGRALGIPEMEQYLPRNLHWKPISASYWPWPIGHNHPVYQRHLRCSMVKGDTIVLIRLIT